MLQKEEQKVLRAQQDLQCKLEVLKEEQERLAWKMETQDYAKCIVSTERARLLETLSLQEKKLEALEKASMHHPFKKMIGCAIGGGLLTRILISIGEHIVKKIV